MINQGQKVWSVAWAWAAGWALVSMGQVISGAFNRPNNGLTAFYVLGFAGWAIGAAGTIRYVRSRFGADIHVTALSAAGWCVGALVAVVLWFFWAETAETWQVGFLGPIVAPVLGGVIGGAFTLPMRSLSSAVAIVRASLLGAFSWGAAFLVFQFLAFYAGYILMLMTAGLLAPTVGWVWAQVPGWALPAGIGGFLAGWLASLSLRFKKREAV